MSIPTVFDNPKWLEQVTAKKIPLGVSWVRRSPHFYKIVKGDHLLRKHFTGHKSERVQWNLRLVESTFTGSGNLESLPEVQQSLFDLLKLGHLFKKTFTSSLKAFIAGCPALQKYHEIEDLKALSSEDIFHIWAELNDAILCDGDIVEQLKLTPEVLRDKPVLVNQKRLFYYFGWDLIFAVINTAKSGAHDFNPTAPVLIAVNGAHFEEILRIICRKKTNDIDKLIKTMKHFTNNNAPTAIHHTRGLTQKVLKNMGELKALMPSKNQSNLDNAPVASSVQNRSLPLRDNQRALRASRRSCVIDKMNRHTSFDDTHAQDNSIPKRAAKRQYHSIIADSPAEEAEGVGRKYMRLEYCTNTEREKIRVQLSGQRAARAAARHFESIEQVSNPVQLNKDKPTKKDEEGSVELHVDVIVSTDNPVLNGIKTPNVERRQVKHDVVKNPLSTSNVVQSPVPLTDSATLKREALQLSVGCKRNNPSVPSASTSKETLSNVVQADFSQSQSLDAGNGVAGLQIQGNARPLLDVDTLTQRSCDIWRGDDFAPPKYAPSADHVNQLGTRYLRYFNFKEIFPGNPVYDNIFFAIPNYVKPDCVKVLFEDTIQIVNVIPFIPAFDGPDNWEQLDSNTIAPYATCWVDFVKPNLPSILLLQNLIRPPRHNHFEQNSNGAGLQITCPVGGPFEANFLSRHQVGAFQEKRKFKMGNINWSFVRKIEDFLKNHVYSASFAVTDCQQKNTKERGAGEWLVRTENNECHIIHETVALPDDV